MFLDENQGVQYKKETRQVENAIKCSAIALAAVAVVSYLAFLYVRHAYRDFCMREDQKERIGILLKEIGSAKDYVRKEHSTPMDSSIPNNIVPKIDFLVSIIRNRDLPQQEKDLTTLRDMLAETFLRLKDPTMDVISVLSPLNTLRDRLVREHLDWIRDHMDESA